MKNPATNCRRNRVERKNKRFFPRIRQRINGQKKSVNEEGKDSFIDLP